MKTLELKCTKLLGSESSARAGSGNDVPQDGESVYSDRPNNERKCKNKIVKIQSKAWTKEHRRMNDFTTVNHLGKVVLVNCKRTPKQTY